jgi:hypothetical protein
LRLLWLFVFIILVLLDNALSNELCSLNFLSLLFGEFFLGHPLTLVLKGLDSVSLLLFLGLFDVKDYFFFCFSGFSLDTGCLLYFEI